MDTQTITVMIYPEFRKPEEWSTEAYVFGIWAVHEPHPDDYWDWGARHFGWSITHLPSGRIGFHANDKDVALEAARRLAVMDEPSVTVDGNAVQNGHIVPRIEPLSIAWIKAAVAALDGLELWATPGEETVELPKLHDLLRGSKRYAPQFAAAN